MQNSGKNGGAGSNPLNRFSAGGGQLLGFCVNVNAGSNPLKQFSAGGGQLLGFYVKQFSAGGCSLTACLPTPSSNPVKRF